jgi:hypothetical protein
MNLYFFSFPLSSRLFDQGQPDAMQSREQTLFFLARSISLYIMCARVFVSKSSGGQHPSVTTKVKLLRVFHKVESCTIHAIFFSFTRSFNQMRSSTHIYIFTLLAEHLLL